MASHDNQEVSDLMFFFGLTYEISLIVLRKSPEGVTYWYNTTIREKLCKEEPILGQIPGKGDVAQTERHLARYMGLCQAIPQGMPDMAKIASASYGGLYTCRNRVLSDVPMEIRLHIVNDVESKII
ncbi:hypothetical protein FRB94_004993 [Tulasnella sp. JGI-2019a]|nr:hypothetical protein FRB94_004993 [Tulasnella sp. JGI-2019a]